MVFLKTDDLAGNMDSFGKDKMILIRKPLTGANGFHPLNTLIFQKWFNKSFGLS